MNAQLRRAAALFASLDLDATAAACVDFVARELGAAAVRVYLLRGSAGVLAASTDATEEAAARLPRHLAQRLRRADETCVLAPDGDGAAMLIPLRSGGRTVAALEVTGSHGRHGAEVETLAELVGAALGNALSHERTERRAERLAELERTKSRFLSLAAHELRGPLTVLMGYLSLIEDGALGEVPEEFRATLPAINARVTEMDSLINALLDTARLEDDRLDLSFNDEDLRAIAAEAIGRAQPFVHPSQRLRLSSPRSPVRVNVDRPRILIAIGNLVSNALKYSVEHTDVDCAVRCTDEEAFVSVTDRGIGIAPAEQGTLFTRFGRIRSDPASLVVSGTGLGLFLARELVRAHGGDITVESAPHAGSTFTITLPAAH